MDIPVFRIEDVRGLNPIIDQVADLYVNAVRGSGGRIFIGDLFACYADEKTGEKIPFVIFKQSRS